MLCLQYGTETATVILVGQDGHQQQFDIPRSLISTISGPIDYVVDHRCFTELAKDRPDLTIYSLIVGMSGQWENVATMLNIKLNFHCCDNSIGFCKSSHKYHIHFSPIRY